MLYLSSKRSNQKLANVFDLSISTLLMFSLEVKSQDLMR